MSSLSDFIIRRTDLLYKQLIAHTETWNGVNLRKLALAALIRIHIATSYRVM